MDLHSSWTRCSTYAARSIALLCLISGTALLYSQVTVHSQNFSSGFQGWSAVDLSDASDVWSISSGYAQINGYGGGNDEDWLISPAFDMDAQEDEYLLFDYNDAYDGDLLELYYSQDFSGAMNSAGINSATWVPLSLELIDINSSACFSSLFQRHPSVDISSLTGTVNFAFKYQGMSNSAKRYRIDNIHIEAEYYSGITSEIQNGLRCADLKSAISQLSSNTTDRIRYSSSLYDVWDAFLHTDDRSNDAGSTRIVWDMFTDIPSSTGEFEFDHCIDRDNGSCPGGEGNCYNREHTFPRSWWGGGTTLSDTIYSDLHHICPSDRSLNTSKSNYPPGEVQTITSSGTNGFVVGTNSAYPCAGNRYFEPIDNFKGDYARMYFYVAARFENYMSSWEGYNSYGSCAMSGNSYPSYEPWMIQVLLDWHALDPVDQKERDRNNAVYAIQGNRNAFIDNPNYVNLVWGSADGTPCGLVPLPIELAYFKARAQLKSVALSWSTLSEINNDYFTVERSKDGLDWEAIHTQPGAINSSSTMDYRFEDYKPIRGLSYYRLKQTDLDGQFSYSHIEPVNYEEAAGSSLVASPNPAHDLTSIRTDEWIIQNLTLYDLQGRDLNIQNYIVQRSEGLITLDLSSLPLDVYLLRSGPYSQRIVKY